MGTMTTTEISRKDGLPLLWRKALQRDQTGANDYADPAPERQAGRMLAAYIATGLFFFILPGTFIGVWNLVEISTRHAMAGANTAWIQAHGHAQLFGWVGTFILGISFYVLPKFRGHPLKRFGSAWLVWAVWTLGVALRWWAGITGCHWRVSLATSAVLELAAFAIFLHVVVFSKSTGAATKQKKPADLGSWLGIFGFSALGVALILNLFIAFSLALKGTAALYPEASDRAFLIIAVWGFALPVAWGYSTRFVTIFLGLEQPRHRAATWLCGGVAAIVVAALFHRFLVADAFALAITFPAISALRVFRPSARKPKTVGVYRSYPAFVRLSFIWLVVGAALGVLADAVPSAPGLGGASRHAVTVGFLATFIFAIAPRLLPSFLNGRELQSPRLMAASLWLLTAGCALRVSSEAIAYSSGGAAWSVLPVSAYLELSAVVLFVLNMVLTLKQPMLAWLEPEGVTTSLPVYWYLTSFPKTKSIMIASGLKTLKHVREVPRSLTLAEAVEADGADAEQVLQALREFFRQRQPRRLGR
jgi:uncharacterized protein involved in response to NO